MSITRQLYTLETNEDGTMVFVPLESIYLGGKASRCNLNIGQLDEELEIFEEKDFMKEFDEEACREKFRSVAEDDQDLEEMIATKKKKFEKSQRVTIIEQVREKDGSGRRLKMIEVLEKEIEGWCKEIARIESASPSVYGKVLSKPKGKSSDGSFGCGFRVRLNKIPAGKALETGWKCAKCPKFYWGKVKGKSHERGCKGKKDFEKKDTEANRLLWRPS
jgi:hypothetical protein